MDYAGLPNMKIAVVVPAFNEEASIRSVVQAISAASARMPVPPDIVVVNDGSTDSTVRMVSDLGCIILELPFNVGIGGAVQLGLRFAYERGYDAAIQVDADGQHPAEDIPRLLETLETEGADVVIGSRFLGQPGFRSTPARRAGIRYFNAVQRLLTGVSVTDSTSGFRALSRQAIAIAHEDYPDEYPEPESLVLYSLKGLVIREVPVTMRARQGGRSSIHKFDSLYYMAKVTLAMTFTFIRLRWRLRPWKT